MAQSILPEVTEMLFEAVDAFAKSLTPQIGVAYPSVPFTPGSGNDDKVDPYLTTNVLPNTSDLDGLSFESEINEAGLLSVNVVWPAGQGVLEPVRLAAQVAAAFKPGTVVARNGITVRVYEYPRTAPAILGDGTNTIPVTVRWVAWIAPGG